MKKRFGVDFNGVRIHTDSNAVQMSRELNAQAFTYGRDIYFGAGRYSPGTSSGRRLLAHELTHVVQQGESNIVQREEAEACDSFCLVNRAADANTANFNIGEFACNDGTAAPEIYRGNVQSLMNNLEILRGELGNNPTTVNSGYRTCEYNRRIGGANQSRHLCAQAADIRIRNHVPNDVHTTIERLIREGRMLQGGLGLYSTFVHYDVRGTRSRW